MTKGPLYVPRIIGTSILCIFIIQALMITAAVAVCSCREQGQATEAQKEPTDPGSPVNAKVNETITIILDSNATTGYQWRLARPIDEKAVKLVSSEYKAPETQIAGAGGREVWIFKALSKGQTSIVFEYVRSWEKDKEPAKKATFTVSIQ